MKDIPILFSAPMVQAILREIEKPGTGKTETRRILMPQPPAECSIHYMLGNESWLEPGKRTPLRHSWEAWQGELYRSRPEKALCGSFEAKMRFTPGDRLYVREAWRVTKICDVTKPSELRPRLVTTLYEAGGSAGGVTKPPKTGERPPSEYVADLTYPSERPDWAGKLRPGMFMPRWASRITLVVEDVKVERLQEISEESAQREGATSRANCHGFRKFDTGWSMDWSRADAGDVPESDISLGSARHAFGAFINVLHGGPRWNLKPTSLWDENPWVAAIRFRPYLCNIDAMERSAA